MNIIEQNWKFLGRVDAYQLLNNIESAGRVCYKSEDKITEDSAKAFVREAIKSGHYSVIEHGVISIRIITDRGVGHELIRHRLASYSQESTRYCNYSRNKFGKELTMILPVWFKNINPVVVDFGIGNCPAGLIKTEKQYILWKNVCKGIERDYFALLELGQSPQEARSVLPNSLKTEIIMTANPREWRHILQLRTSTKAHPQIRELMLDILQGFKKTFPVLFEDITE